MSSFDFGEIAEIRICVVLNKHFKLDLDLLRIKVILPLP